MINFAHPKRRAAFAAIYLLAAVSAHGQVSLNTVGVPVNEDFNALAASGTANVWTDNGTIAGWYSTQATYRASTGTSTAGALYSFGSAAGDRALGSVGSGGTDTVYWAVRLLNNTGAPLTGVQVAYVGEQWRYSGTATAQSADFQYQIAAGGVITGANAPSTGWVDENALDFTGPIASGTTGALDGNDGANRASLSSSIAVSVPVGEEIWLRWVDINHTGSDHALAIDDVVITAEGGPPLPVLSINDVSMNEGDAGATTFSFTASLDLPAPTGGVSFNAETADGSATLADADYDQLVSTPFSIPATQQQVVIDITVNGDMTNEPNEIFTVNLSGLSGATAGDLSGDGTIVNDDGVTPITVSLDDASVDEGDATSGLTISVSLDSPAAAGGVSFDIQTNPGTALAGDDYVSRSLTNQTIAEGLTSYDFVVDVVGDIIAESPGAESFTVTLSNVSGTGGGTIDNSATVTINDDDPIPRSIAELQGTGRTSAFADTVQASFGNVVTAVGSNLFAMQMPAPGDGDAFTSDGILVFTGGVPGVLVGDLVNVKGNLVEFFEQTEFTATGGGLTVEVVGSAALPAPMVLDNIIPSPAPGALACQGSGSTIPTGDPAEIQNFECFEAMLVSTSSGIINAPHQSFSGDLIAENHFATGGARVKRETGIAPEAAGEVGIPAGVALWDGNPELFELDLDKLGLPADVLIPGSSISATGVIGYEFGDYELWPTSYSVNSALQLPSPAPIAGYNQLGVGMLNVENLFDTVDDPNTDDTIVTPQELDLKLGKLSAYIRDVLNSPAVLALIEVENQVVLDALAARINADDPTISYTGVIFIGNSRRGINNAFLTRNVAVSGVTQLRLNQMTNECSGTAPCFLHDRPSLLLEASFTLANGQTQDFAVLASHFRSLSGIDNQSDLANALRVRRKRLEQAVAIAEESQSFQSANPSVPLISLGDFNAFEFTDGYTDVMGIVRGVANVADDGQPRDTMFEIQDIYPAIVGNIVDPPLTEAMFNLPADDQYSFLFGCSFSAGCFAQALDHTLLNAAAQPFYADFGFGRGNADARRSDAEIELSPLRSADHDGSVLILNLGDELLIDGFESP